MKNETQSGSGEAVVGRDTGVAVAIILPSLFALVLLILLTVACLLPKCASETDESKERRRKKRLGKLDANIQAENYVDWAKKEREIHPEAPYDNITCVICLEEFEDAAQIRGLGCHHVFHQGCLDDWYGRWNEYCPLCHRPIIPGDKKARKNEHGQIEPPPPAVALMV